MSTCHPACVKTFIQQVKAPTNITAYWTMNEATDNTNLADSVGGCDMHAGGGTTKGGVAAKYSLGQEFSFSRLNTGFDGTLGSNLDYTTGNSFGFWGWFKIIDVGGISSGLYGAFLSYYMSGGQQLLIEIGNSDNPANVHVMGASNDVYFNVTLGAWHFFYVFFDNALGKVGYSIDGAAAVMLANPETWPSQAGCVMLLEAGSIQANTDVIWDEVGIVVDRKLTAAQIAYLYNSGTGRTWPISLP